MPLNDAKHVGEFFCKNKTFRHPPPTLSIPLPSPSPKLPKPTFTILAPPMAIVTITDTAHVLCR